MYKLYQVLVQDLDENVDENLKDLEENLAWLTQKTEDPKGIKGTLLSPHTRSNMIELHCKVIKCGNPPSISTSTPPPFQVYLPFLAKDFVPPPQLNQILEGRTPPPLIRGVGGGVSDYVLY